MLPPSFSKKRASPKPLNILKENEDKLHEIAKYLLDKETITGEEFMEIYEKNDADAN